MKLIFRFLLLLAFSSSAFAADNYVKQASNDGTTTVNVSLATVTAGNAIVAFCMDGSSTSPTTFTVSDGQGSYTAKGSAVTDTNDSLYGRVFLLEGANSGTHSITCTADSGNGVFLVATEIGVTSQPGYLDAQVVSYAGVNVGPGANLIATPSVTISAAATVVAFATAGYTTDTADTPTVGTSPFSFTSRATAASGNIGAWRLETAAGSSSGAATFGAPVNGNFTAMAIALLNTGSGGGGGGTVVNPISGRGGAAARPLVSK